MERNYVQPPTDATTLPRGEHIPIQARKKPETSYSFLLDLAGHVKLPLTYLSSLFTKIKRTPFQHQRKDVPKKLRQAIGERLTDIIEVECEEPGRVLFIATGKKSGKKYEIVMRDNYSKVISVRA